MAFLLTCSPAATSLFASMAETCIDLLIPLAEVVAGRETALKGDGLTERGGREEAGPLLSTAMGLGGEVGLTGTCDCRRIRVSKEKSLPSKL